MYIHVLHNILITNSTKMVKEIKIKREKSMEKYTLIVIIVIKSILGEFVKEG